EEGKACGRVYGGFISGFLFVRGGWIFMERWGRRKWSLVWRWEKRKREGGNAVVRRPEGIERQRRLHLGEKEKKMVVERKSVCDIWMERRRWRRKMEGEGSAAL
ncbi:hypothetical protein HAX54_038137, partial [Datura stramonium]|nr:hypothetical protein [Datura stramonium]